MAKRASPRFADWPEADQALWGRLTARGTVLDGSGPGAHWRPRTEQYHRESYGLWLAWLMAREPATLALPPLQRATPERMATWIYTGTHLRPITRLNRFIAVRSVLTLLEPAADWTRHRRIEARLYREASRARSKRKIGRIVETDVIFHAAVRHHKLLCDQPLTRKTAVARRNAVMVALLALMPVRTWSFSTISGNWKRGTGILNNELYVGRLIWNRQRFIKDPETGKRQARPNPPEAWITEDVPHLRIIDEAMWHPVKQRQGAIRSDIVTAKRETPTAPGSEAGRRARYLLSGLLHCGCCGSGYIMISDSRYGCAAARNSGTCSNRKTIKRSDVEARVLAGLKHHLLHPDLIAEFIAEFQREMQKDRTEALTARRETERKLAKVCSAIDSIITAITEGMFHPSMKAKMDALEAERATLEAAMQTVPVPDPVALHPGLCDIYARKVADLAAALNAEDTKAEAADILRGLIERIVLHPDAEAPNGHAIELYGALGAILSLCDAGSDRHAKARTVGAGVLQVTMVAGAGINLNRTSGCLAHSRKGPTPQNSPSPP